jgi:hypothetical protein
MKRGNVVTVTCKSSWMMRYGDSGFASLVKCGFHSASHGSFCD